MLLHTFIILRTFRPDRKNNNLATSCAPKRRRNPIITGWEDETKMTAVAKVGTNPIKCKYKEQCRTNGCTFTHDTPPQGSLKSNPGCDCKYDRNCKRLKCFYDHKNGRIIDDDEVTDTTKDIQSEEELIASMEVLLSEATERNFSKQERKHVLISGDDNDSEQSEDDEPVLDIVTQRKTKEFGLHNEEFRLAVTAIKDRFNLLNRVGEEQNFSTVHNLYKQLQREMKYGESRLPIYAHRNSLVQCLRFNRILILKADTGSGKSTQIVQYLCDEPSTDNSESSFSLRSDLSSRFSSFRANHLYTAAKAGSKHISCSSSGRVWV
jgi:hypothetical protein